MLLMKSLYYMDELIVQPSIDGLFTGRAAWQVDNFDKLIRDAKATYEAK